MPFKARNPFGNAAEHLAPTCVPERDRVKRGAGAEGRYEEIDEGDLDQNSIDQANQGAEKEDHGDRERPRQAVDRLQADRQNVPQHDAVSDRKVDLARHHRDHRGERQKRDDRLVGDDRAQVEKGRERVRQDDGKERDEKQSGNSAGRRPAGAA